jgi:hypothetical protein
VTLDRIALYVLAAILRMVSVLIMSGFGNDRARPTQVGHVSHEKLEFQTADAQGQGASEAMH